MRRGELTTIEKLAAGDRFYYLKDKNKEVWEVVSHKRKKYTYGVLSTVVKSTGFRTGTEHVKLGRQVVFLRNTIPIINP